VLGDVGAVTECRIQIDVVVEVLGTAIRTCYCANMAGTAGNGLEGKPIDVFAMCAGCRN
jgi:hypothetical protein